MESFINKEHDDVEAHSGVKLITEQHKNKINAISPCDEDNADEIIEFLSNKGTDRKAYKCTMNHSYPYDIHDLKPYLYFPNLNYRPHRPYRRIDDATYRENARMAIQSKEGHANGVKGLWPFAMLPYADIKENISYDGFHVLMNIAKYSFKLLFLDRDIREATRTFCRNTDCHPQIWCTDIESKDTAKKHKGGSKGKKDGGVLTPGPWVLGGNLDPGVYKSQIIAKINIHLSSICMPKGFGEGYRVQDIIANFKTFKGIQLINFITNHMDYFCYVIEREDTKYPKEYLLYYSMLSSLFSQIQVPIIVPNTIDTLYKKGVEIVEIHGGMFPPSESVMIYHQLIDMIQFLNTGGPMKSWWSIPIERAMVGVKNKKTNGGNSFYKSMVDKEYAEEFATMSTTYATEIDCFSSNEGGGIAVYTENSNGKLKYDPLKFHLIPGRSGRVDQCKLNNFEKTNLLSFLVEELELLFNEDNLTSNCPTYRLFKTFRNHCERFHFKGSFYDWMLHMIKDNFLTDNHLIKHELDNDFTRILHLDTVTLLFWTNPEMEIDQYRKALVWGTKFIGRGNECSERDEHRIQSYDKGKGLASYGAQNQVKEPSNPNNVLRNHYSEHIGSWCKIHKYISDNANNSSNHNANNRDYRKMPQYTVGQINYFSYLRLPNDTLLTNLPFASVTARKQTKVNRKHYTKSGSDVYENLFQVDGKDDDSIDYELPFAMLYNIYPTPLAFTAYEIGKPNNKEYNIPICMNNKGGTKLDHLIMYAMDRQLECIHTHKDCIDKMHPYHNKQIANKFYVTI